MPVPNIFMPPLYPLFLYVLKLGFNETNNFLNTVFIIQTGISLISIFIVYKILIEIFNENMQYLGVIIYAIFPINIFAVSQISSITIQMFLINVFLYQFIKIFKNPNNKNVLLFSLPSSLLILLRGEFLVFVILSLLYLLIKHNCIKKVFASLLFILILISPYLYRNYQIFEQVTITKSFGYNLLKGNHPGTAVEGTPMFRTVEKVIPETKKIRRTKRVRTN